MSVMSEKPEDVIRDALFAVGMPYPMDGDDEAREAAYFALETLVRQRDDALAAQERSTA